MQVGRVTMLLRHQEFNGFRQSIYEDCIYLAPILRFADKREILDGTGMPPYNALVKGYVSSEVCFTIVDKENTPVGMFGVSENGAIWLLASDNIQKIRFSFLRESRKVVELLNQKYRTLWNYVDCRNELHLRWLKWCGFKFIRQLKYGVNQKPFYEFIRICATQQQR